MPHTNCSGVCSDIKSLDKHSVMWYNIYDATFCLRHAKILVRLLPCRYIERKVRFEK